MKNPIQPLATDAAGVLRFKKNALVCALLQHGQATGLGLNDYQDAGSDGYGYKSELLGELAAKVEIAVEAARLPNAELCGVRSTSEPAPG